MNSPNTQKYQVWKTAELSQNFLEGVRAAIPLAAEQIDCLMRIIGLTQIEVTKFLDLGCGDGILGRSIYQQYPESQGLFLDLSETMLESAKAKIQISHPKSKFLLQDFGQSAWVNQVIKDAPFDVIVSGFSIHHLPDERKKQLYQEIYDLLKPGGIFLNLEHVASKSKLGEKAFDQLFIDALYSFHKNHGSQQTKAEIDKKYYSRSDKEANILLSQETQCEWLRQIGFVDVDCFMKLFEIALFGGVKSIHVSD